MGINEIKKFLYKEKPIAKRSATIMGLTDPPVPLHYEYKCRLKNGSIVHFGIPASDMGENVFEYEMPAQLLIRWIVAVNNKAL